jgi:pyridoxine kinase
MAIIEKQKRVLAIHDISCFGRCSLTVALPIISVTGAECTCLPTAVLSTHTGGLTGYTFKDLTGDLDAITKHWKSLGLTFDAIYTGYLGSIKQIEIVAKIIDTFKTPTTKVFVDPVMADNGALYTGFSKDFPKGMATICERADVIMPNITEACLLLEQPYTAAPYTKEYISKLVQALGKKFNAQVVLTGVDLDGANVGAATYDGKNISLNLQTRIPGYYHGTGDVFGSALVGAMLKGKDIAEANRAAVRFTVGSILRTYKARADVRYGVNFEEGLVEYASALKESK